MSWLWAHHVTFSHDYLAEDIAGWVSGRSLQWEQKTQGIRRKWGQRRQALGRKEKLCFWTGSLDGPLAPPSGRQRPYPPEEGKLGVGRETSYTGMSLRQ